MPPNSAVNIEMDIPDIQTVCWQDMLRYNNRVKQMKSHRLPKSIYNWDMDHHHHHDHDHHDHHDDDMLCCAKLELLWRLDCAWLSIHIAQGTLPYKGVMEQLF